MVGAQVWAQASLRQMRMVCCEATKSGLGCDHRYRGNKFRSRISDRLDVPSRAVVTVAQFPVLRISDAPSQMPYDVTRKWLGGIRQPSRPQS
jgi:hypothetical protein